MRKAIQRESIDKELRNRLWSAIQLEIWDKWETHHLGYTSQSSQWVEKLVDRIWLHYWKEPLDTVPVFKGASYGKSSYDIIRDFFFEAEWWVVYDFIEFLIKASPVAVWADRLKETVNRFLEDENAAYRIVGNEIVEITDEQEIEAVESTLDHATKSVREHLSRSLELLSDHKNPDYRNSIKESILAVESACKSIAALPKATLGDCIKVLKTRGSIHPAFEQALLKLYGYANDEGGIRHALTEESVTPTYADAKFMLVAVSAFTSFLWTKAAELRIELSKDG